MTRIKQIRTQISRATSAELRETLREKTKTVLAERADECAEARGLEQIKTMEHG